MTSPVDAAPVTGLVEAVTLERISFAVGTPVYVTSAGRLRDNARRLKAVTQPRGIAVHYAVKANGTRAVIHTLALEGFGADVVSRGEAERALNAEVPASDIVFSGVGKTDEELAWALEHEIGQINVESAQEVAALIRLAAETPPSQPMRVLLRVNPEAGAGGHDKITTGRAHDKFGIAQSEIAGLYRQLAAAPGVDPRGLAIHIGSLVESPEAFRPAYRVLARLVAGLRAEGLAVDCLDLGGGFPVPYTEEAAPFDLEGWGRLVDEVLAPLGCRLMIEPGRYLVADAALLLARCIRTKHAADGQMLAVLDAGMTDLIRPALYEAVHRIVPVVQPDEAPAPVAVGFVGPICESSDRFTQTNPPPAVPPPQAGQLVAILTAGAYGAAMASTYNGRSLTPEVLVDGDWFGIIRRRWSLQEQLQLEP